MQLELTITVQVTPGTMTTPNEIAASLTQDLLLAARMAGAGYGAQRFTVTDVTGGQVPIAGPQK